MSKKVKKMSTKLMLVLMLLFTALPSTGLAEAELHNDQAENDFVIGTMNNDNDDEESSDDQVDSSENNEENSTDKENVDVEEKETEADDVEKDEENQDGTKTNEKQQTSVEESEEQVEEKEEQTEEETEEADEELEEVEEDEDEEGFELKVMHLNDTHSHADKLPNAVTEIKEQRAKNEDNLLLHAGDSFSGTLYFNESKGQADLKLFNLMKLDAFAFGNHEFDLGTPEGHPALQKFIEKADFPFLGANVDFSADPTLSHLKNDSIVRNAQGGQAYNGIIKEFPNGEEVGIFGLTTEDTKDIASPELVKFLNYKTAAENAVKQFEEEGINKIIAVTHLGYDSNPAVGNDLLLADVDGIDIIVGGHSHTVLPETIVKGTEESPTLIVQTGQYVDNLGVLDVTFDEDGNIIEHEGELVDLSEVEPDPEAVDALAEYKTQVDALFNEPSGAEALKDLTNPRHDGDDKSDSVRANETELGNLVTDAMLAKAKEKFPETLISLQNGGGIRAPIDKGPIMNGEIINVLPFGNDPVVATITGAELKEVLEHSVSQAPNENGGFLHVAGMRYYYDSNEEVGERVFQMDVLIDGKYVPIEEDEAYMITTNQFTAQGGDGFDTFKTVYEEGRVTNIGEVDWEQLRSYMVNDLGGKVDPVREGRILNAAIDDIPEDSEEETPDPDPTPEPDPIPEPDPTPDPDPEPEDPEGNEEEQEEDQGTVIPSETNDEDKDQGSSLPNTATTMYTILLIGSLLLLVGIVFLAVRKLRTQ